MFENDETARKQIEDSLYAGDMLALCAAECRSVLSFLLLRNCILIPHLAGWAWSPVASGIIVPERGGEGRFLVSLDHGGLKVERRETINPLRMDVRHASWTVIFRGDRWEFLERMGQDGVDIWLDFAAELRGVHPAPTGIIDGRDAAFRMIAVLARGFEHSV